MIVQQMVAAANENQKGFVLLTDFTDVFLLLIYHYRTQMLKFHVIMESPVKDSKNYSK